MSATLHLYKLDKEVHYLGTEYSLSSKEERKEFASTPYSEHQHIYEKKFEKNGKPIEGWDYVDVSYLQDLYKYKYHRCMRYTKYINLLRSLGTDKIDTFYGRLEVLPVKEVLSRQGWFLKEKFLNKQCSWYFATTKKGVEKFFDLYLDVHKDNRGIEVKQAFLDTWQDGMLFEAAY